MKPATKKFLSFSWTLLSLWLFARLLLPLGEFTAADVQEMAQDFKVNGTV